jgi:hypothetical protein
MSWATPQVIEVTGTEKQAMLQFWRPKVVLDAAAKFSALSGECGFN